MQTHSNVTDKDNSSWLSPHYGTTALIDARLTITPVFYVAFLSKFDRDGLFVDITLSPTISNPTPSSGPETSNSLHFYNIHLESLIAFLPVRPAQLFAAAAYLHAPNITSALLAGDMNAIEPFDHTLHTNNRIEDAYLSLGGKEDSEEGYTWGLR